MKVALAGGLMALWASSALAAGPTLEAAAAYVREVYRSIPTPGFDYRNVRYTSELQTLLRRDAAYSRAANEVGVLDAIPFCDCQDNDPNYAIVSSRVAQRDPRRATVHIALRNGSVEKFAVEMRAERGLWRVADIRGPTVPSLLTLLRREVPVEEASIAAQNSSRSRR